MAEFVAVPPTARQLADEYLHQTFDMFDLPEPMVANLAGPIETVSSRPAGPELQFREEKVSKDTVTVSYAHTQLGIPVWNSGVAVRIRREPMEVISAQNEVDYDLQDVTPPPGQGYLPNSLTPTQLAPLLGLDASAQIRINHMSLVIYRYAPNERTETPLPTTRGGKEKRSPPRHLRCHCLLYLRGSRQVVTM